MPWQVSWLAGHRLSPVFPAPYGSSDLWWTSARRLQLRGQLRLWCLSHREIRRTGFPLSSGTHRAQRTMTAAVSAEDQ
jgi:hypothetical protein